jgi:23S rRNA pseudouridine1911/1915/1917 synthase
MFPHHMEGMVLPFDANEISRFTGKDAPLVQEGELAQWIVHEDDDVLAFNKPGWLVCHPSKAGPMSSLIGAAKVYTGMETLHLVSRLDRETSGIVLVAKTRRAARQYQGAIEDRRVQKTYLVWLTGEMKAAVDVDQPLARDNDSLVHVKQCVRKSNSSQRAQTRFEPLHHDPVLNLTLARVIPITGRKHQIRAHALWLGYPVFGDKLYGPDDRHYLNFIETGWTDEMAEALRFPRQALHALSLQFESVLGKDRFEAPLPSDLHGLCQRMGALEKIAPGPFGLVG